MEKGKNQNGRIRQIEVRNELGQGEPSEKINKSEEGEERWPRVVWQNRNPFQSKVRRGQETAVRGRREGKGHLLPDSKHGWKLNKLLPQCPQGKAEDDGMAVLWRAYEANITERNTVTPEFMFWGWQKCRKLCFSPAITFRLGHLDMHHSALLKKLCSSNVQCRNSNLWTERGTHLCFTDPPWRIRILMGLGNTQENSRIWKQGKGFWVRHVQHPILCSLTVWMVPGSDYCFKTETIQSLTDCWPLIQWRDRKENG